MMVIKIWKLGLINNGLQGKLAILLAKLATGAKVARKIESKEKVKFS